MTEHMTADARALAEAGAGYSAGTARLAGTVLREHGVTPGRVEAEIVRPAPSTPPSPLTHQPSPTPTPPSRARAHPPSIISRRLPVHHRALAPSITVSRLRNITRLNHFVRTFFRRHGASAG